MDEMKSKVFLKITQKHDFFNKENKSRYVGLIRDNFSGWKLEKNLLLLSLKANIPQEFLSEIKLNSTSEWLPNFSINSLNSLKTKFITILKTKFWLTQEASEWLVETWIKVIFDYHDTKAILSSLPCNENSTFIPVVKDSTIQTKIFNFPTVFDQSQSSDRIGKSPIKIESQTNKSSLDMPILDKIFERVSNNKPYKVPKISVPSISTETKLEVLNPKTVRIPAGTFTMGSPKTELGRAEDERIHKVTISKDFLLCVNPVTQELWRSVMDYNFNKIEEAENFPITNVSWDDCQDFIKKFNILTSEIYRLPTEAEWEYACRAGTDTAYSFGKNINEDNANYKNNPFPILKPVCSCLPNDFGLYDMHGNVWEWCEDWYGIYISTFQWLTGFSRTPLEDPYGPIKGEKRVIRGGSFNSFQKDLRSSCRSKLLPTESYNSVGFRLVKEIYKSNQ